LDDTSHDALLYRLIAAATSEAEGSTGSRLMTQTLRLESDGFPIGDFDLGVYPVASITSLAYDDADGNEQTLAANTDYWADLSGMYPRVLPVTSWPSTKVGKPGSVRVTVVAGHPSIDDVPEDLRHSILVRVQNSFMPGDTDNAESFIERSRFSHRRLPV
jgi:uncharacterized phiE125 gp8 family phage protein